MNGLNPISILVKNERGVLSRVAGLFARRGFNIISLAVGETQDPALSRISVVVKGDAETRCKMVKQLERLVSVIEVNDLSREPRVEIGLALIKVKARPVNRAQIAHLADIFRTRIAHVDQTSMIVEATGNKDKLEALMDMLRPYGILEMARTGQIVLSRETSPERYNLADDEETKAGGEAGVYELNRA